jgi:hypothetical protein
MNGIYCTHCKQIKPKNEFYKTPTKKGVTSWCKSCLRYTARLFRKNNLEKAKAKDRKQYYKHREKKLNSCKKWRHDLRIETFTIYSYPYDKPICVCCHETNQLFLTIDHINNNGANQRRELGATGDTRNKGGVAFYKWLKDNNWPKGYQTLCYNCNCGKRINNNICPHKVCL